MRTALVVTCEASRLALLFGAWVTAIIPRPLRPQFGAPVADGFCAGLSQVASRSNADQPAAGLFRRTR